MPARGVIFDLDGTLVDSLPGIAHALNHALAAHGHPVHPEERVRTFIGDGLRMTCRRALPPQAGKETVEAVLQAQMACYARCWREGTRPYEGIPALLHQLQEDRAPFAILSNKPHSFTVEIAAALFPSTTFAAVLGQREGHPSKPDPGGLLEIAAIMGLSPGELTLVGDSTVDYQTAANAGMPAHLVSWGYHDRPALAGTKGTVVDTVTDLRRCLAAPRPA